MKEQIKAQLLFLLETSNSFSYSKLPKSTYGFPMQVPVEWDIWVDRVCNVILNNFRSNSIPVKLATEGNSKAKTVVKNSENHFNQAKERLQYALSEALKILENDMFGEINMPSSNMETQNNLNIETQPIEIFVSHSSKDVDFIKLLVELILGSIKDINPENLRCTSLPGFKLPTGSHASSKLRNDIKSCKVLIGVITENSLDSLYVMFELGAAWGLQANLYPICGPNCTFESFRPPLSEYHGIKWTEETDWSQFVEDLASKLGRQTQNMSRISSLIKKVTSFTP